MQKILSAAQIREADKYTIEHEPVSSIDLMERAAISIKDFFLTTLQEDDKDIQDVLIVCGNGNNGGDGLALARLLAETNRFFVEVLIVKFAENNSPDFDHNLERLFNEDVVSMKFYKEGEPYPDFSKHDLIVDAILGTGLRAEPTGFLADIITEINLKAKQILSVDIPSGVFADLPTNGISIHAHTTVSFEVPKLAFFMPDTCDRIGDWFVRGIDLHPEFLASVPTDFYMLEKSDIREMIKPRHKFSHKGDFGQVLLIAGSRGKMGAAILSTRAALRSGAGLVTTHVPGCGYEIIQMAVPEAMCSIDEDPECFSRIEGFDKYDVVAIGPGLSTKNRTRNALCYLLKYVQHPMVLDADALNILSNNPEWLELMPEESIITPHPKEFERLFGTSSSSIERARLAQRKSMELGIYIILKGAFTTIYCPDGNAYINPTGNPGMATAGSGDVLTGFIAGLLAQRYTPKQACQIGVYWHGLSGDHAAVRRSQVTLIAGDIIRFAHSAWKDILFVDPTEDPNWLPF